ncbi:MAG: thioesterase family protein [Actinomycetota bacterium]
MLGPVFHLDGDTVVPTELARGPWDMRAQHGGPVSSALARAIERCDPQPGLEVMRVVVDILRPVPLSPLRTQARIARGGKRVQLIEASLFDGDQEVARASGWRQRVGNNVAPAVEAPPIASSPDQGRLWEPGFSDVLGFWMAVEWRFVAGYFSDIGPATGWCRITTPLFEGEDPTPLQRVMVAADFGNGISGELDFLRYLYINVDLSVHLHRHPRGEWIGLDAATSIGAGGVGLTRGTLHDTEGPIGGSAQQLVVDRRPPA